VGERGGGKEAESRAIARTERRRDVNLEKPIRGRNRKNAAKSLCFMWIAYVENCRECRKCL